MTQKWQDPDYRQKMTLFFEERKRDPLKTWSRRGVPNGFTRDKADLMWLRCNERRKRPLRPWRLRVMPALHPYAREALAAVVATLRSEVNDAIRLKAARLLGCTQGKPPRNHSVTVQTAEEWLEMLTA